jgi:hypothetical protein
MIGTAAAILGAAVIGGGVAMSASSKASKAASDATAANNLIAQQNRDQITGLISPYMPAAYGAQSEIANLLKVGNAGYSPQPTYGDNGTPTTGPTALAPNVLAGQGGQSGQPVPDYDAYLAARPDVASYAAEAVKQGIYKTPQEAAAAQYAQWGAGAGNAPIPTKTQAVDPTTGGTIYGPSVAPQQTYTRPDTANAPALPDISFTNYTQSPYYDWLTKTGQRNLDANFGAKGLLGSGAAAKEAIQFGQDTAGAGAQQWVQNQLGLYDRAASQSNIDAARSDARFDSDRAFGYGQGLDTRNYDTSRFDTKVNNLFALSNQGLSAAGALAGAGTNYANQVTANNNSQASVTGNAAIAGSNSVNNLLGTALNAYGYFNGAGAGASKPYQSNVGYTDLSGLY